MTVSVIIPAYNQGHFLGQAIRSVLDQTYQDFEIIVVDDGSTDNTAAVVGEIIDPRLKYVHQANAGLSAARNTGIRNSAGAYLTFLDSDDIFLPDKLAILTQELDANGELGFVAGMAIPIDEAGRRVGKIFDTALDKNPATLLLGNPLHVGSVMLRRAWQEKVGFFDETLRSYEDWDMWLRLGLAGCQMGWVPRAVSLYRFHGAQMTRIGSQMTTATFAVLDNIFRRSDLPEAWLSLKNQAYSNAHLRAAAQAYHGQDYSTAQDCLEKALALNPPLADNDGESLVKIFLSWTDLPKAQDPLKYIDGIFTHLPGRLERLARKRRKILGQVAVQQGFEAYQRGERPRAQRSMLQAIGYWPLWLANRGVLSVLFRTSV